MRENKVHVAFGFHVNCYHSYRGDTNDNLGFGSDIRIIRKILDVLTEFNQRGIPVKGTWDSENFFSLERIFPQYAPDIIEKMKIRVEKYGDENIIMGYSNGALGAMNEAEFEASIEKAVTNEQGSGLQDLFGTYEKIVRPQEVMFTPSQVSLYNKLGVKALCLYYSCVPFDAFRTIIPAMDDEKAFNPLTYTYKGESMTVIPTYSNSDVCDAGCLRKWVKELHAKQISGEIDTDLFLFINMDADAIFWETMNLPVVGSRIANTDGIHGLVNEVADLDFVVFDTPGGYLKTHKPVGEIDFTHDTADGNFTGYASWAEKPYNRKIWTSIERSRMLAKVNADSDFDAPSFQDRVVLLSTTHFGLATPVLNIQREKKADELAARILESEKNALGYSRKITIHNTSNADLQCVQLKLNRKVDDVGTLVFTAADLLDYTAVSMDDNNESIYVILKFKKVKKQYTVSIKQAEKKSPIPKNILKTKHLEIRFLTTGGIYKVLCDGKQIGTGDFLRSFITYDKKKYSFQREKVMPLSCAGSGEGLRIAGEIHLPGEKEAGSFTFDFFTFPACDAVFVRAAVKYPYTPETTSISTENSVLGRYSDMKWSEAVPFQLTPHFDGDIRILKRNFMGDISSFRAQSFPESDPKNKSLASFNHQLSAGMVGLTDGERGLIVANARQVLCSMAHCPMRLDGDKTVHMNPFGTYYGAQRHHWGRANDEILATYTLVTPQGKSIAPAYNGSRETAMLALFGFSGEVPNGNQLADILAFADGAAVSSAETQFAEAFYGDNVQLKAAQSDGVDEKKLKNPVMSGFSGNLKNYIVKGSKAIGHIVIAQIKAKKQR